MLLDNKKQFVELVMDNIMWGNVKLDKNEIEKLGEENIKKNVDYLFDFTEYRQKDDVNSNTVISDLYFFFIAARINGGLVGELRDRDHEQKIEQLTKDNEKLSEQLSQAYVPSHDGKIGTI